jgi:limonene-1,2-epoxide hydrolase
MDPKKWVESRGEEPAFLPGQGAEGWQRVDMGLGAPGFLPTPAPGPRSNPIATSPLRPRALVLAWVEAFNRADAEALASFYALDAINHQVAEEPVQGRAAIRAMFEAGFAAAEMVCLMEQIFEDGEWAVLEWRDPLGLRGCGFFHVIQGRIAFQRGYWDKLSFLRQHHLPLPTS